jgi:hypothetical protein
LISGQIFDQSFEATISISRIAPYNFACKADSKPVFSTKTQIKLARLYLKKPP